MIKIHKLTYNPFSENMYILSDETNECAIIDPGCYAPEEREHLKNYIVQNGLKPVKLWNTHCHLDHVFGNYFVAQEWGLELGANELDLPTLHHMPIAANMYGINGYQQSPEPSYFINEGDKLTFGNSEVEVLFTPGHAPGHVVFYSINEKFVINGDVLFQGSFGRYDLPGGDLEVLKKTITEKMFKLPEDMVVYTGHGPETTIGAEKMTNPILSY
ncbi:MAG: MBL fold hydrolase [Crocinitomix sp. MedPE-SWsnd]|nr:MAG: MBL fold hydrolase [Crocinitomix sp. MedPE-SWsnd]